MTPHKAQHIKRFKTTKKDTHIKQYPRIISGTHIQTTKIKNSSPSMLRDHTLRGRRT